jgi:hypothetical protein
MAMPSVTTRTGAGSVKKRLGSMAKATADGSCT